MTREKRQTRHVESGCRTCHGERARWTGANAQAVAARHHDSTGHSTGCRVALSISYGSEAWDDRQIDIEDAIAAIERAGATIRHFAALASDAVTGSPAGASAS